MDLPDDQRVSRGSVQATLVGTSALPDVERVVPDTLLDEDAEDAVARVLSLVTMAPVYVMR